MPQKKQEKALLGCVVESSENLLPDRQAQLVRELYNLCHPVEQRRSGKGCSWGGGLTAGQPEALHRDCDPGKRAAKGAPH